MWNHVLKCVCDIMSLSVQKRKEGTVGKGNLMLRWSGNHTTSMCICSCQLRYSAATMNQHFLLLFSFLLYKIFKLMQRKREKERSGRFIHGAAKWWRRFIWSSEHDTFTSLGPCLGGAFLIISAFLNNNYISKHNILLEFYSTLLCKF